MLVLPAKIVKASALPPISSRSSAGTFPVTWIQPTSFAGVAASIVSSVPVIELVEMSLEDLERALRFILREYSLLTLRMISGSLRKTKRTVRRALDTRSLSAPIRRLRSFIKSRCS